MARASEETTLRRFSEGLLLHNIRHEIGTGKPHGLFIVVDGVTLGLSVHDGSVNLHQDRDIYNVPVPSRRKRFSPEPLLQCLQKKKNQIAVERARLERIRPFAEVTYAFERASVFASSRARIKMDTDIQKDGRIGLQISGYFTLDELRRMMEMVQASGVLNEEVARQVMES